MANMPTHRTAIVIWTLILVLAPITSVAAAAAATGPTATTPATGDVQRTGASGPTAGATANARLGARGVPENTTRAMQTPEGEEVVVNQTFRRTSGGNDLIVTVEIDASRVTDVTNYAGYIISVPDDATVLTTENLSESAWSGYQYQADGGTSDASLEYRVPAGQTSECSDDPSAYTSVDQGSWAFTSRYSTGASVVMLYQGQSPPDVDVRNYLQSAGAGHGASGFVFVGPHDTYERSFGQHDVTLVVPTAARDDVHVGRILGTLQAASEAFDVGKRSEELTFFTPPSPIRPGGAAVGTWYEDRMDAWVYANATFGEVGNTWIHEYVHTRQAYSGDYAMDGSTTNMTFAVEGGADYAAALLSLHIGNTTFDQFYEDVNSSFGSDEILGDQPAIGCGGFAKYTKGRRVFAALDLKIRNETDGEKTFMDLFARLNEKGGFVTYSQFQDAVEATAGTSFDAWLDKYVQTGAVPSLPNNPFPWSHEGADIDGDGLDTAAEREAGTHPFEADSDHDGVSDGREVNEFGSDPNSKDTDGDGVPDGIEVEHGMDPTSEHSDDDGIPDDVEWQSDALDPTATDTDGDGLDDDEEREHGTDPSNPDTDGDGVEDGVEVEQGTDPTVADSDDDGLDDGEERTQGTDPLTADTDGDGIDDGDEVFEYDTDPTEADTDGDGVSDGKELLEDNTDPTDASDYVSEDGTAASATATATATSEPTTEPTEEEEEVVGPSTIPGFGAPAALAALLAGTLFVLRGRRD